MLEVKFFRDEKNVYFNNPNGITIKKSIEDFEKWIAGEGGGGGGVSSVNGQTGAVVIANATTSAAGLMSETDKIHLDAVYADYSSAITALGV